MEKKTEEIIKKIMAGIDGLLEKISDKNEPYFNGQAVGLNYVKELIDITFPELKESEDERIISNDVDELNLLKEIQNYHKKNLAGLYITFAMYKRIARHFYSLGKKQK